MYERYAFPAVAAHGAENAVSVEVMENAARTAHRATIVPKGEFIRFRTHRHRFGTGIAVVWGIKSKGRSGPRGGRVYVHALLFDRRLYSPQRAKAWLKSHGYKAVAFEAAVPVEVPAKRRVPAALRARRKVVAANMLPEGTAFQYVASMNPVGPKTINEAIRLARQHAPSPYARAYADAAMKAATMYGIEVLRVQMLYVLNNLATWRGPLAQETKKFMKAWIKAQDQVKANPSLMILTNPCKNVRKNACKSKNPSGKSLSEEIRLAQKAYKSFHFNEPKKQDTRKVPDGWPKVYVVLGTCDAFEVNTPSGKVRKVYRASKPTLACTKDRKDIFIFSRNGKLGIPAGTAVRVEYTVPGHSGRMKRAPSWYHLHESNPVVRPHKSGMAVRITGPGLSVSPRGIIG